MKRMLNQQQQRAVSRVDGKTLLLAVPGSGKTTVIISRIAYMIQKRGIRPGSILTLTFSRAGARDLARRYEAMFGKVEELRFSTIHSFSLSVIRMYERRYGRKAYAVLKDQEAVVRGLFRKIFEAWPGDSDMADILSAMTYCKNRMLTEEQINEMKVAEIDFPKLLAAYEAYKREHHMMDFDDMLRYAYLMLKQNPDLLEFFQNQYRYIHIDEAQDTSKLQFAIIRLLAEGSGNLFMVGDEDQSIYGFRGAWPDGLLSFKEDYPDGEVLLMETNHRSTAKLVAAADRFITLNKARYAKHMRTDNPSGFSAVHEYVKDAEEQYRLILAAVKNEHKDIAVLYRNNESAIPLVDLLEQEGIPYAMREHNPLFFTHFVVQDIKDYTALAADPSDGKAFSRLYYKLGLSISRKHMQDTLAVQQPGEHVFDALLSLENLPDWLAEKVSGMADCFERLASMTPEKGIDYILAHMGYQDYLDYRARGAQEAVVKRKMTILKTLARRSQSFELFWKHLDALQKTLSEQQSEKRTALTLSTIHSSKGLEFDKVFIIDAVEGEFPTRQALGEDEESKRLFDEEVRLFYVGVTRAKRELEFITIGRKNCTGGDPPPSRFITYYMGEKPPKRQRFEKNRAVIGKQPSKGTLRSHFDVSVVRRSESKADVDISRFTPGTAVIHRGFGEGVVKRVEGDTAQICFERCGTKRLNLKICVTNKILDIR